MPLHLNGTELFDEWKTLQSSNGGEYDSVLLGRLPGNPGSSETAWAGESFYRKRTRDDDRLDASKPLENLFDQIRVCDPDHYPAWFELRGRKYKLSITPL